MNEVKNSTDVYSSRSVYSSRYVDSSCNVDSSRDVDSSWNVYSSRIVDSSRNVDCSHGVIFCHDIKMKEDHAFNKQVTEERFYDIREYWDEIKGDFNPSLKDYSWEEEWKKLPKEVWEKLSDLPEFDKSVVEKIVGFEIELEEKEKIEIEGKKYTLNEIKKALNK